MSTQAQTEANRRNSQKSTGPRTEAGKARSRMNALKYGLDAKTLILPCEDPAQYRDLREAMVDEHQPSTPTQVAVVDIMVTAVWKWRRFQRAETELYTSKNRSLREYDWYNPAFPLTHPVPTDESFMLLQRRIESEIRILNRSLDQLRRLKRDEAAQPVEAASEAASEAAAPAPAQESEERTQCPPARPPESPAPTPAPVPPGREIGSESMLVDGNPPASPEGRLA